MPPGKYRRDYLLLEKLEMAGSWRPGSKCPGLCGDGVSALMSGQRSLSS